MKRRDSQERDDTIAREQAESRREKLLADLKAREEAGRQPPAPEDPPTPASPPESEPSVTDEAVAEPDNGPSPEEGAT
ncbi:MAG: hypothetical protein WD116_01310 [Chloroflexota bacterium]